MLIKFLFIFCMVCSFLSPVVSAKCNKPPTKKELIELLGNPINCNREVKDTVCFGKFGVLTFAELDSANFVKRIYMDGCDMREGKRVVDFIFAEYERGKLLKSTSKSEECDYKELGGGSGDTTLEEYECLTVRYAQSNCPTNCIHYGIEITFGNNSVQ
jgi:hypothetical protein